MLLRLAVMGQWLCDDGLLPHETVIALSASAFISHSIVIMFTWTGRLTNNAVVMGHRA